MGSAPFHVVLDEVAYYATSGMDRMLAMGRGLNFMFWLGFQEVSGIWARLGEKTQSLFGNANLTIAMRQQDANRTRQWIEDTAGKTYVTQATSYQGGGTGEYAETRSAEVREVSGVDWRDLQSLIEGEAIILFGGRRIYAKLFHAEIDTRGPMRLNRPVALAPPDVESLKAASEHVGAVLKALEGGLGTGKTKRSATLAAMLGAFQHAAAAGQGGEACVEAALEAAKDHPMARDGDRGVGAALAARSHADGRRPPSSAGPLAPAPPYVRSRASRGGARDPRKHRNEHGSVAGWRPGGGGVAARGGAGDRGGLRIGRDAEKRVREIEIVRQIEALSEDIRADGARLSAGDAPTADAQVEADDAAAPRSHGAAP